MPAMLSHSISVEDLIVERSLVRELQCCICLCLLDTPLSCKMGHLFCAPCVTRLLGVEGKGQCPECRASITADSLARALFVEKAIRSLKVFCKYRFALRNDSSLNVNEDPLGCKDILTLETRDSHEAQCQYRFVLCPLRCSADVCIRANAVSQHVLDCPHRMLKCRYCEQEFRAKELGMHEDSHCMQAPETCTDCKMTIRRSDIEAHESECPERVVSCHFEREGCKERLKRKELLGHDKEAAGAHLVLVRNHYERTLQLMMKTRDTRISELEQQVLRSATLSRGTSHTLVWKLANYQETYASQLFVRSRSFVIHDFCFFFGLYPRGEDGEQNSVGIFLFLKTRAQDHASITLDFSFSIVNMMYAPLSVTRSYQNIAFPLCEGEGWGDHGLLKCGTISEQSGFLSRVDEALSIHCTFRVKNIRFDL